MTPSGSPTTARLFNDRPFGLGVFTRDVAPGERLAAVGIEESGYRCELAVFGIREVVAIKTIVVAPQGARSL